MEKAPYLYAVRTSAGFLHVTSDFASVVTVAQTQLDRYGYPKYQEWLADLDATAGVLDYTWFYGHISVDYYDTPLPWTRKPRLWIS